MGRLSLGMMVVLVGAVVGGGAARGQTPPPKTTPASAPAKSAPAVADDDWQKRFALSVELGPGGVITAYTPNPGPNSLLFMTGIRAGYDFVPRWSGSLTLRQWWLPGEDHAFMFGPGARFEPYELPLGRVFVDGSLGLVSTNDNWTVGLDLGGGFEFEIPDAGVSFGPYLRFGYVANPNSATNDDGTAWSLGASITYHFGRASAATTPGQKKRGKIKVTLTDTDRDGIGDESDECPKEPQGKHPDQFRIGCPETDSDEDGIPDTEDPCPTLPPGEIPDPNRLGCPISDEDGDGVPDSEDACPAKKGVGSSDPVHNGCPAKKQPKAEPEEAPPETPEGLTPIKTRKRKMK